METGDYLVYFSENILLFSQTGAIGLSFGVFAIFALLFCSALISGSEVAYFSLTTNANDLANLRKSTRLDDKRVLQLINKPGYLLATILITNNFINVSIIILSSFVLGDLIPPGNLPEWLQFTIEVVLVTFFLVFFGEISPKIYANINNLKLARFMSRPLIFLNKVLYFISKQLVKSTTYFEKRLAKQSEQTIPVSIKTIGQAIELTVKDGKSSKGEKEMLKGIVYFSNVTVKQVMTTRVNVVALNLENSFETVLELAGNYSFSRMPVYQKHIDEIVGILYIKDLLPYLNESPTDFKWQSLLQTPYFVQETEKVDIVLEKFKQEKVHIAIVVDEYGGVAGIITLEDVLEEIIGEITDEFDDEKEIEYQQLENGQFIFEGRTMLNDVCRIMNLELNTFDEERGDADSIAGLILEQTRGIPKQGTIIHSKQFRFSILSANERRIKKVIVTLLNKDS